MPQVLSELAADLSRGAITARALVEDSLSRIGDPAGEGSRCFVKVHADQSRSIANFYDGERRAGRAVPPFAGIPFSVKDLFDEAGEITRAGSRVLTDAAPAKRDAPAIARLKQAGFIA